MSCTVSVTRGTDLSGTDLPRSGTDLLCTVIVEWYIRVWVTWYVFAWNCATVNVVQSGTDTLRTVMVDSYCTCTCVAFVRGPFTNLKCGTDRWVEYEHGKREAKEAVISDTWYRFGCTDKQM